MNKEILIHLRSLERQIKDAYSEGKLDELTYHSMLIDVNLINNNIVKVDNK